LPLDLTPGEHDSSDDEQPGVLAVPGLEDRAGELAMLDALASLAKTTAQSSSKWRAISRVIRSTAEPVIFFTEFRDTLRALGEHLRGRTSFAVLHGGLDRAERAEAVAQFTRGAVRALIATDAAAEGLNLQARCRLLVNVELPWSPRVLEQRAGRIDRIGQARTVRVWELAGHAGHEAMVTAALERRRAAIQSDLAATLGLRESIEPADANAPSPDRSDAKGAFGAGRGWWQLQRRISILIEQPGSRHVRRQFVWVRARRAGRRIGRGVLLVFASRGEGPAGALQHVAVHVSMTRWPPGSPSQWLAAVVGAAQPAALAALTSSEPLAKSLAVREAELAAFAVSAHSAAARRWQPSFFDRRAERVVDASRRDLARLKTEHEARLAELCRQERREVEPVLALLT
jgi:hypothetical protein